MYKFDQVDDWITIGQSNPWIREAYDPPLTRASFHECATVEDLKERIGQGNWCVAQAFYLKGTDLCFINQVDGGDEWLTIRHGFDFESITWAGFIERGEFEQTIAQLLRATEQQCRDLTWGDA